jgi:hypothetical protein
MARGKRAALYVRVSTDGQTVENQVRELRQVAERRGWEIVETYSDAGISGAKGRDERPGLDRMLGDAKRRRFDVVMAWAIDRLGRSLIDLLGTIQVTKTGAPRWDCAGGGRLVCLAANWISLSRFGRTKACVAGALFFCSRSPICLIRR